MANYGGTILTQLGRNLLAKALTGATLQFTKVQLGDGVWDSSVNPELMTALVHPTKDLSIQELAVVGDGTARLRFILTNTGLTQGFFIREIGIWARDPDLGEILYAVTYASNPDFIPAEGVVRVENIVDVYTVVATAQNVTAVISDTIVLATKDDITKHIQSTDPHPNATKVAGKALPQGDLVGTTDVQELLNKLLRNIKIKDVDPTPVTDILLKVIDGILQLRNADDTEFRPLHFKCIPRRMLGYTIFAK